MVTPISSHGINRYGIYPSQELSITDSAKLSVGTCQKAMLYRRSSDPPTSGGGGWRFNTAMLRASLGGAPPSAPCSKGGEGWGRRSARWPPPTPVALSASARTGRTPRTPRVLDPAAPLRVVELRGALVMTPWVIGSGSKTGSARLAGRRQERSRSTGRELPRPHHGLLPVLRLLLGDGRPPRVTGTGATGAQHHIGMGGDRRAATQHGGVKSPPPTVSFRNPLDLIGNP